MANFFSNLFNKETPSVLGIDIGSSSIKIVQLQRKSGRAVLETYGELSLGPYAGATIGEATNLSVEKIVEAMGDLLREKEVHITTRACGIAIPFASSFMTTIEMPEVPLKQLAQMIPLEARKYIPVPISEVTLDWSVIPKDENVETRQETKKDFQGNETPAKCEVLIVALHNDTIARYKELVAKSALDATFFEIEIFSTMRAVLDQEVKPVMIIDMGATSSKIYIVERAVLRGSHTINRGAQTVTNTLSKSLGISINDAEVMKREKGLLGVANGIGIKDILTGSLDYIFAEASHIILEYEKKYNKNISKVMLVGGGSALKGITEVAQKSLQTEVVAGDPFSKVSAPAFLEDILRQTGPEFAVAVGIALRKLQEV